MKEKPQSEKKPKDDPGIMYEYLSLHPGQHCGDCTMFLPESRAGHGHRCTDVIGPINRSGWCKIYKRDH